MMDFPWTWLRFTLDGLPITYGQGEMLRVVMRKIPSAYQNKKALIRDEAIWYWKRRQREDYRKSKRNPSRPGRAWKARGKVGRYRRAKVRTGVRTKEYIRLLKEWKSLQAKLQAKEMKLSKACVPLHESRDVGFLLEIGNELASARCMLGRFFFEKAHVTRRRHRGGYRRTRRSRR